MRGCHTSCLDDLPAGTRYEVRTRQSGGRYVSRLYINNGDTGRAVEGPFYRGGRAVVPWIRHTVPPDARHYVRRAVGVLLVLAVVWQLYLHRELLGEVVCSGWLHAQELWQRVVAAAAGQRRKARQWEWDWNWALLEPPIHVHLHIH